MQYIVVEHSGELWGAQESRAGEASALLFLISLLPYLPCRVSPPRPAQVHPACAAHAHAPDACCWAALRALQRSSAAGGGQRRRWWLVPGRTLISSVRAGGAVGGKDSSGVKDPRAAWSVQMADRSSGGTRQSAPMPLRPSRYPLCHPPLVPPPPPPPPPPPVGARV